MRQDVGDDEPPARRSTRAASASASAGSGTWCRTWTTSARSSVPDSIGSASRLPSCRWTLVCPASRSRATASISDEASTAITEETKGASAAAIRPEPQPRSPTTASGASRAGRMRRSLVAPNSSARRSSHWPAAVEKNGTVSSAGGRSTCSQRRRSWPPRATRTRRGARGRAPRAAARGVEPVDGEPVVARRAVAASGHPAGVAERLQVPRDGALRQREGVAQLGDGQLDAIEAGEQAAPGGRRRAGPSSPSSGGSGVPGRRGGRRLPSVNPDYCEIPPRA